MKRIYARNTEIRTVDTEEAKEFLNNYHNQKWIASAVYYGLYYNNELVQIESFGLPRIEIQNNIINHDWELLRECSKKDYYVIGGKSKLLKAFERDYKPLSLLSYCDTTAGFDGHSYRDCGFTLERTTTDYWYEYNGNKIKRYEMQKNSRLRAVGKIEPIEKTLNKYGKKYDPNLTERENAENAGFKLVKGKGQQTWTKYYSDNIGYVYEITGPDGKTYIGQHILRKDGVTKKVDYFASGVAINRAVKKYGKKAFKRRVIEWTTDLAQLTDLEYKYIIEAKNNDKAEYNISVNPYNASSHRYQNKTPNNSSAMIEYYKTHSSHMKGKHPSAETRRKMGDAHRGKPAPWTREKSLPKVLLSEGYKNRDLSNKNHSYDDNWKAKVSNNTVIGMTKAKEEAIKWIHDNGFLTKEDLMKKYNLTYKQVSKTPPVGKYKKLNYYK